MGVFKFMFLLVQGSKFFRLPFCDQLEESSHRADVNFQLPFSSMKRIFGVG